MGSIRELVASGSFFATESQRHGEPHRGGLCAGGIEMGGKFLLRVGIILVALLDCGSGYNAGEFWNGVMIDDAGMGDADPDGRVFYEGGREAQVSATEFGAGDAACRD